jgi:lipopolysaccharide transport protein LptA
MIPDRIMARRKQESSGLVIRWTAAVVVSSLSCFGYALPDAQCQNPKTSADRLEVTSERLELDTSGKKADFIGNVVVRKGKLYLRCEQLTATYDGDGVATQVRASGKVKLSHGDIFATATNAEYDRATDIVSLGGGPVVWRAAQKISGTAMRIHLKTERIEVDNPRGTMALPAASIPSLGDTP